MIFRSTENKILISYFFTYFTSGLQKEIDRFSTEILRRVQYTLALPPPQKKKENTERVLWIKPTSTRHPTVTVFWFLPYVVAVGAASLT